MYRVRFVLQRPRYRTRYVEGIYIPPKSPIPISEMKRDCTIFVRRQLEERDPDFRRFNIELIIFKRLRTDFLYNASRIEV